MRTFHLIALSMVSIPLLSQPVRVSFEQHLGTSSYASGLVNFSYKFSSSTGLTASVSPGARYAIQSGLYYHLSGTGNEVIYTTVSPRESVKEYLHQGYIRIPLIFKIKLGKRKRIQAGTGGYFNIFTHHNITTDNPDYPESAILENLNKGNHDYGILLRTEYLVSEFPRIISIGIQQELGLQTFVPETRHIGTYALINIKLR